MPTLADIYSMIDSAKRRGTDFIRNPGTSLQQMVGNANDRARAQLESDRAATDEFLATKNLNGPLQMQNAMEFAQGYNPVGMISGSLTAKYPNVALDIAETPKAIDLSRIVVPKELRGQGMGSSVMQDLIDYADETGKQVRLSPTSDFGGSPTRLKKFYKEFGFVENKGRNKDFSTRETMIRSPQIKQVEDVAYRGQHTAPGPDFGAPLHDLTGMYPSDVYAASASRIYGGGVPYDRKAFDIAQSYRDKPNATVTIYRAVPKEITNAEKLASLEKQMAAYMKRGTLPKDAENFSNGSKWYDWAYEVRNKLRDMPDEPVTQLGINPGDWVTLTREYAKDHGESALKGQYRILSKKVKAKDIWTNADSIHEFGYHPE